MFQLSRVETKVNMEKNYDSKYILNQSLILMSINA